MVLVLLTAVHVVASLRPGRSAPAFRLAAGDLIWLVGRLRRGGLYAESRDATWEFVEALRLPHYFRLGLLGFVGAMAWLALPVTLLAMGRRCPGSGSSGALGLGIVATVPAVLAGPVRGRGAVRRDVRGRGRSASGSAGPPGRSPWRSC